MEPADHDMYRAAIHGDLEAFEFVIRNMSRPLFAIAFGALQNREEAEDVVQEALSKPGKHAGRFSCQTAEETFAGLTDWKVCVPAVDDRPFLLETFKHRKMSRRLCARRKPR